MRAVIDDGGTGTGAAGGPPQVIFSEPPFEKGKHLSVSTDIPDTTDILQEESVKMLTSDLPLAHEVGLKYVPFPEDDNFVHSFKLATSGFGESVDDAVGVTQLTSL